MPTLNDAAKLSVNPYSVTNFRAIATSDEVFGLLDFVPKGGNAIEYTREKSIGSFGFIADDFNGDISESSGADEKVSVPKRQAVSDFYVEAFDQANQSGLVNQLERQTTKKFKAAGRLLANKLINGRNSTGFTIEAFQSGPYVDAVTPSAWLDSNRNGAGMIKYVHAGTKVSFRAPGDNKYGPELVANADGQYLLQSDNPSKNILVTLDVSDATADAERAIRFTTNNDEFDGLKYLISAGQTRAAKGINGDLPRLAILDELIHAVKQRTPGRMAFMMHSSLVQAFEGLMRATPWNQPPITIPGTAFTVPAYKNIPLLANDFITRDESKGTATTLSSIYHVNMSSQGEEGFFMGALGGGSTFNVEADPRDVAVLGFRLSELGAIQKGAGNKIGRRLAWYGCPALGSDLAASRAKEIITDQSIPT